MMNEKREMEIASTLDEMICFGWRPETFDSDFDNYETTEWTSEDKEDCRRIFIHLWGERGFKYWLDCDSTEGAQFALYEKAEEETCILKFGFDDINGLEELEAAGQIAEAYELIDKYIETELGFLPEYEVG